MTEAVDKLDIAKLEAAESAVKVDELSIAAQDLGRQMEASFSQMIIYGKGFGQVVESLIAKIGEMIIQAYVFKSIANSLSGKGGIWGTIGGFFAGLAGKAGGGSVAAGVPYEVGERGPEMFVPNVSGAIVPNGKLGGDVYNIDARGADVGVERRLIRALKAVHGSAVKNAQMAMHDRLLRSGA